MSSVSSRLRVLLAAAALCCASAHAADRPAAGALLRVCADPNNLPFSDAAGQGFENAIARMAADDLHRRLAYTWLPQRRGFVRHTLNAGSCDVIVGVPSRLEMLLPTAPYYRSSYVFITRADRGLHLRSFDDPRLRRLRIGVHAVGDDYANVPPALALARRGIVDNLRGYSIYGDYSRRAPARGVIDALQRGDVDVAVVWGPFASLVAGDRAAWEIHPVEGADDPALAMRFDISMGVRKDDPALRDALDGFIARRHADIRAVLDRYGVPVVADAPGERRRQ